MRAGVLYGIGVGPGDPELLTIKAVRLIKECDILAIPQKKIGECFAYRIALNAVPEVKDKPVLPVDMPMTRDKAVREAAYKVGAKKIAEVLSGGRKVVFLTLGDPSVYSTFAYLAPQVRSLGFDVVWIPGVTSFCASAAALGQSLCADREELHIIPVGINAGDALSFPGTKVFMKGELDVLLDVTLLLFGSLFCAGRQTGGNQKCCAEQSQQFPGHNQFPSCADLHHSATSFRKGFILFDEVKSRFLPVKQKNPFR